MLCWEEKHEKKKKRSSCTQLIRKAGHHKDDNTKMLYLDLGIFNSPKLRSYFLIVVLDCCRSCERKHCKLIWAGSFRMGVGGEGRGWKRIIKERPQTDWRRRRWHPSKLAPHKRASCGLEFVQKTGISQGVGENSKEKYKGRTITTVIDVNSILGFIVTNSYKIELLMNANFGSSMYIHTSLLRNAGHVFHVSSDLDNKLRVQILL